MVCLAFEVEAGCLGLPRDAGFFFVECVLGGALLLVFDVPFPDKPLLFDVDFLGFVLVLLVFPAILKSLTIDKCRGLRSGF